MRVWHYTILDRAKRILLDGKIKAATAGVPTREIPVVWFSAQQVWEPTANKMVVRKHALEFETKITLTTRQMFDGVAGPLVRFGIDSDTLLPWAILKRKAKISRKEQTRLIKKAKLVGSDPMLWYGHLYNLVLWDTIEGWVEGKWYPVELT